MDGVPWENGHPSLSRGGDHTAMWKFREKLHFQWKTKHCLQHSLSPTRFWFYGWNLLYNSLKIVAKYIHADSILPNSVNWLPSSSCPPHRKKQFHSFIQNLHCFDSSSEPVLTSAWFSPMNKIEFLCPCLYLCESHDIIFFLKITL